MTKKLDLEPVLATHNLGQRVLCMLRNWRIIAQLNVGIADIETPRCKIDLNRLNVGIAQIETRKYKIG